MRAVSGLRPQVSSGLLSIVTVSLLPWPEKSSVAEVLDDEARTTWCVEEANGTVVATATVACKPEESQEFEKHLRALKAVLTRRIGNNVRAQFQVKFLDFVEGMRQSDFPTVDQMAYLTGTRNTEPVPLHVSSFDELERRVASLAQVYKGENEGLVFRLPLSSPKRDRELWSPWDLTVFRHAFSEAGEKPLRAFKTKMTKHSIDIWNVTSHLLDPEKAWQIYMNIFQIHLRHNEHDRLVPRLLKMLPSSIAQDPALLHSADGAGWGHHFWLSRQEADSSMYTYRCQYPIRMLTCLRRYLHNHREKGWLLETLWDPLTAMYDLRIRLESPLNEKELRVLPHAYSSTNAIEALYVFARARIDCTARLEPLKVGYHFSDGSVEMMTNWLVAPDNKRASSIPLCADAIENLAASLIGHSLDALQSELRNSYVSVPLGEEDDAHLRLNLFPDGDIGKHWELMSYRFSNGQPPTAMDALLAFERIVGAQPDEVARACLQGAEEIPYTPRYTWSARSYPFIRINTRWPVSFIACLLKSSDPLYRLRGVDSQGQGEFSLILETDEVRRFAMPRQCLTPQKVSLALRCLTHVLHAPTSDLLMELRRWRILRKEYSTIDLTKRCALKVDCVAFMKDIANNAPVKVCGKRRKWKVTVDPRPLCATDGILLRFLTCRFQTAQVIGREKRQPELTWEVYWPAPRDLIEFRRDCNKYADPDAVHSTWKSFIVSDSWLATLSPISDDEWVPFVLRIVPLVWGPIPPDDIAKALWQGQPLPRGSRLVYSVWENSEGSKIVSTTSPVLLLALLLDANTPLTLTGIESFRERIALTIEGETSPENLHKLIDSRFQHIRSNEPMEMRARLRRAVESFFWMLTQSQAVQSSSAISFTEL